MAGRRKKTPESQQDSTDEALKKHSEYTGLSLEELRIISEMLKESLVEEFSPQKPPEFERSGDAGYSERESSEDNDYYEADEGRDEYDIESFRAHSPVENFYMVNDIKECPICGSKLQKFGQYSLEFGQNVRKRANFCGLDCLKEFIEELSFTKGF